MTTPARPLSGPHKAAIALLSLDEDVAALVLARMPEPDLRRLVGAVEELDDITGDVIARVLDEVEQGLTSPLAMVKSGGVKYVRRLADRAFGTERAQKLLGVAPPPSEPLQLLRTARVNVLAQLLADEHPQVAAVVLTQLAPPAAAKVLALLPREIACDLTARIAELDEIPEQAVAEASESLIRALESVGGLTNTDPRAEFDGLAFSAAVVNEMSPDDGDELLGAITERDDKIAARIREAMFTFEDLRQISTRDMGTLLRTIQGDALVTAMQTATPELREHFLSSLSQRAAATLRDDLTVASPRRLADVEAAQREIIEAATRLAAEGKLTLPPRGGE